MSDLREEYLTMPDEELRKIYKELIRLQRFTSVIPLGLGAFLAVVFTLSGFYYLTGFGAVEADPYPIIMSIVYYVMAVINGMFLLSDTPRVMKKAAIVFIPIHLIMLFLLKRFSSISIFQLFLTSYLLISGFANIYLVKKIVGLRDLPSFPFNSERARMVAESSLTREQMVGYLQRMDKNQCTSTGFEDILEGKMDKHLPKEPDKEEFFQQHKMIYRSQQPSKK